MRSLGEIYDQCQQVGLTNSQRHFSTLWGGRSENWFSSALARQETRSISTEALLGFYMSLTDSQIVGKASGSVIQHATITMLRSEVWGELMNRVGR